MFSLQGSAAQTGSKKFEMSSIECRGSIPPRLPQNSPEPARAYLSMSAIADTSAVPGVNPLDYGAGQAIDAPERCVSGEEARQIHGMNTACQTTTYVELGGCLASLIAHVWRTTASRIRLGGFRGDECEY
jgi:hypothetical protein